MNCPLHKNQKIEFICVFEFCEDSFLCLECKNQINSHHTNHNIKTIHDFVTESQNRLSPFLKNYDSSWYTNKLTIIQKSIQSNLDNLLSIVQNKEPKEENKNELEQYYNEQQESEPNKENENEPNEENENKSEEVFELNEDEEYFREKVLDEIYILFQKELNMKFREFSTKMVLSLCSKYSLKVKSMRVRIFDPINGFHPNRNYLKYLEDLKMLILLNITEENFEREITYFLKENLKKIEELSYSSNDLSTEIGNQINGGRESLEHDFFHRHLFRIEKTLDNLDGSCFSFHIQKDDIECRTICNNLISGSNKLDFTIYSEPNSNFLILHPDKSISGTLSLRNLGLPSKLVKSLRISSLEPLTSVSHQNFGRNFKLLSASNENSIFLLNRNSFKTLKKIDFFKPDNIIFYFDHILKKHLIITNCFHRILVMTLITGNIFVIFINDFPILCQEVFFDKKNTSSIILYADASKNDLVIQDIHRGDQKDFIKNIHSYGNTICDVKIKENIVDNRLYIYTLGRDDNVIKTDFITHEKVVIISQCLAFDLIGISDVICCRYKGRLDRYNEQSGKLTNMYKGGIYKIVKFKTVRSGYRSYLSVIGVYEKMINPEGKILCQLSL